MTSTNPLRPVWRLEAPEGPATKYDTLIEARTEPPTCPESEIRGAEGLLAESDPFECIWILTGYGRARIEREVIGLAKTDRPFRLTSKEVA